MDGFKENSTPISQSIVANIQLGLPATVSRLSSKMRFIDKIAPALKESGVVRNIDLIAPLTIKASGIAATNRTSSAFGGMLYVAGAVRQDILISEGSIYKTRQESIVDVDEIDDLDNQKKLKFIDIINVYKLLEDLMEDDEKPELVLVDVPLVLERSDAPLEDRKEIIRIYDRCRETIKFFWDKYKDMVYPFNENGIKIASVGTKRFGAIIYALTEDNLVYIPDDVDNSIIKKMEELMPKIQDVGIKRLLTGILVKRTRTAAFQYDGLNKDNRLEPETLRDVGLIGMHIKAGNTTPPLLVEVLGSVKDWSSEMLDELASQIISLIAFDQKKALPLPLWYAKYALKPVEATNNGKNVILEYYKTQAREMLQSEALESIWKEDLDVFED
ncbi:hypothetical protein DFR55_11439 [Herbinix hemicellulosilytica]|jgi:hypothetical protein|uniref:NurA domain-containing protein n=1 Tax=Herbinix hemicellulosilytica TaxID=1564487 RepID=A0A0H5SLY4_HERHM|nr:hypothetical protein [Herbinix hemicellulosilytica]RBP58157.1 hypothetical protein DFR55_11439 [Herbinix hemicellulosilytica]CRZ35821.1 hypothetical protein HHT355_2640 [Herbinix hemicellulosilytica]